MEWVETTGRSIDEAKNAALDALGVAEDDGRFRSRVDRRVDRLRALA